MTSEPLNQEPATLVLAAFKGWSEAAEVSTEALEYLLEHWDYISCTEIDCSDYYSLTENRPIIDIDAHGNKEIFWPQTTVHHVKSPTLPNTNIYIVIGDEPNLRWQQFCTDILAATTPKAPGLIITLGGMLAEVLHNRPVIVHGSTSDVTIQALTGYEPSRYEGPISILAALQEEFEKVGFSAVSVQALVPHYVYTDTCPKASLALLRGLEEILDTSIPLEDLIDEARAWQTGADDFVANDEELIEYVRNLELHSDTSDLPEASGEQIAREFERYLRRREI